MRPRWPLALAIVLLLAPIAAPVAAHDHSASVTAGDDGASTEQTTEVIVTGRLTTAGGAPLSNGTISFFKSEESGDGDATVGAFGVSTDGDGRFTATVEPGFFYQLGYFQTPTGVPPSEANTFPVDGVPDVYSLGEYEVTGGLDVGTVQLPRAHVVRATAAAGDRTYTDGAFNVSHFSPRDDEDVRWSGIPIDDEGRLQSEYRSAPGIELAGEVEIELDSADPRTLREGNASTVRVNVTSERTVALRLARRTTTLSGRVLEADGDPAANDTVVVSWRAPEASERVETPSRTATRTDAAGEFDVTVPRGFDYRVGYFQSAAVNVTNESVVVADPSVGFPADRSPDVYALAEVDAAAADVEDLGTVRLPEARRVVAGTETAAGDALVGGVTYAVAAGPGTDGRPVTLSDVPSNQAGELQFSGTSTPGIDVAGETRIDATATNRSRYPDVASETVSGAAGRVTLSIPENSPPTAEITVSDRSPRVSQTVSFSLENLADPDGDDVDLITWDFPPEPGRDARGPTATHAFDDVGNRTVRVTLVDEHGLSRTLTVTLSVRGSNGSGDAAVPPVVGEDPPTDPDGDGRYEDVNGNGAVTLSDVTALFFERDSAAVTDAPGAFDFNDNGAFSLADVTRLFAEL
jgi:PKD repeat protein